MSIFRRYITRKERQTWTLDQIRTARRSRKRAAQVMKQAERRERLALRFNAPWHVVARAQFEQTVTRYGGKLILTAIRPWLQAQLLELASVDDDMIWTPEEVAEEVVDDFLIKIDELADWSEIDTNLPVIKLRLMGNDIEMDLEEVFDTIAEAADGPALQLLFRRQARDYMLSILVDPQEAEVNPQLAGLKVQGLNFQ